MGVSRKIFKISEKYFKMTDEIAELGAQYIYGLMGSPIIIFIC